MDEFDLIGRCFRERAIRRPGTILGIGDDAAVLATGGERLVHARSTVALHENADPAGYALRVFGASFIRLAAASAIPRWATLGLTMDAGGAARIERFADATAAVCDECGVELVGGDTTRGPARATVFALGTEPQGPRHPSQRHAAAATVRLPLATAHDPVGAIAEFVSTCLALSGRGATIRCNFGTDVGGGDCDLEFVAHTDAAGLEMLRATPGRRGRAAAWVARGD